MLPVLIRCYRVVETPAEKLRSRCHEETRTQVVDDQTSVVEVVQDLRVDIRAVVVEVEAVDGASQGGTTSLHCLS